jgi:nucleoside-diphosphate-sugar epimerase
MKTALVLGAGGFIGSHMVKRLKAEGYWVRGVDLKKPEFEPTQADEFICTDLSIQGIVKQVCQFKGYRGNYHEQIPYSMIKPFDEIYQFAADMGGAGYVFTGENDANIMRNSALINLNVLSQELLPGKLFYSSSACMYPEHNQLDPLNPNCEESSAYPANPDSEYGWEKLFSERLYLAHAKNLGLQVRIARYHNIFGPQGTWKGGREKAPAAMCRKVAESDGTIEVWGDGTQTRSFLYIDECIEGTRRLMESNFSGPVNIGSDEMISINGLAQLVSEVANKPITIKNIPGPLGVRGRNSDNNLIFEKLGWKPTAPLRDGIAKTYEWILSQITPQN